MANHIFTTVLLQIINKDQNEDIIRWLKASSTDYVDLDFTTTIPAAQFPEFDQHHIVDRSVEAAVSIQSDFRVSILQKGWENMGDHYDVKMRCRLWKKKINPILDHSLI